MLKPSFGVGMLTAMALATTSVIAMPVQAQDTVDIFGSKVVGGKALAKLIEAAQAYPLGSKDNPVRADMPGGQRAYLNRLRCADGKRPTYQRVGSFGAGVYQRIIDGYEVKCEGSTPEMTMVYMDMYHPGHKEAAAVPGFTIQST